MIPQSFFRSFRCFSSRLQSLSNLVVVWNLSTICLSCRRTHQDYYRSALLSLGELSEAFPLVSLFGNSTLKGSPLLNITCL